MASNRILVVAGSDSSGGAGLEADQKVIAAHGCYAMTATTALTAQNTQGVSAIHQIPPDFLKKQILACADDIGVDIVKTGMLASKGAIDVVAEYLQDYDVKLSVIDPVMVSTSGAELLPREAIDTLLRRLLPLTYILTPNIPEAKLLLTEAGVSFEEPHDVQSRVMLAKALRRLGPRYVLLKGGHLPLTKQETAGGESTSVRTIVNVLQGPEEEPQCLYTSYIESNNTHGTGCSLASAIAANLAMGMGVLGAVKAANRYVEAGIKTSKPLGQGSGPINHFHSVYMLPFTPGRFIEYMLDREDVRGPWRSHTEHEFVNCLGKGTLLLHQFQSYLIQDYLFLVQFARATALSAYKFKAMDRIGEAASNLASIRQETGMHLSFCEEFGLSKQEVERQPESQECMAYTRYVLDIGLSEDAFALQVALLPCLIGYGAIARRLADDAETRRQGNPYWKWIETYIAEDYVAAVRRGSELVERDAAALSPRRLEEIVKIFIQATQLETAFWEIGRNS